MLKIKRKKFKFLFLKKESLLNLKSKDFLGGGSPSEKKYEKLIDEYGDDPSFITAFGIKIFPTGDQFVIDAKTNRVIIRDRSTRYLGRDEENGFHVYLGEGSELKEHDQAHPSFIKDKEGF